MRDNGIPRIGLEVRARSIVERAWFWVVLAAGIIGITASLTWGAALTTTKLETKEQHAKDVAPLQQHLSDHDQQLATLRQQAADNRDNWDRLWQRLDSLTPHHK